MAIGKDEILAAVEAMSVIELLDVVKAIEARFGVSAALAHVPQGVVPNVMEEKVEFSAKLVAAGANRINVIRAVRELMGLSLSAAKEAVDGGMFFVAQNVSRDEAQKAIDKLVEAGAQMELV